MLNDFAKAKECYEKAYQLIEENQEVLHKLAAYLVERETITGKEFVRIYEEETGNKLEKSEKSEELENDTTDVEKKENTEGTTDVEQIEKVVETEIESEESGEKDGI